MKDGQIDYSDKTIDQLEEIHDLIDKCQFPKNYENLMEEISKRGGLGNTTNNLLATAGIHPVSAKIRFLNFVIDKVALAVIMFVFGLILWKFNCGEAYEALGKLTKYAISLSISFSYYVFSESLSGKTIGKLVTGTKVVCSEGNKPTISKILQRTLVRYIPLEPLSFSGKSAVGWHDSLSKTYVVKSK